MAISDETGAVVERLAYDPWGKRRHVNGLADELDAIVGVNTERGYTMHEHLDEIGVIHMNGRIYDPLIGRFMSADPFIQSAHNLQSYNRYAYVMNNPLAYTDPSGYFSLKKLVRFAVTVAVAYYTGQWFSNWVIPASMGAPSVGLSIASGAVGGFAAGAVSSGNLKGAVQGGISGGLFGWAGTVGGAAGADTLARYAAHAAAGCVGAEIGGGDCGSGALSAVVGKYTTNEINAKFGPEPSVGKFVAVTIAGGTASVIGGGKFDNGATTAAFGYLFNHCSNGGCTTKLEQALYDWWPGYKAGTLLYNQTMGDGSWTGWEVLDAASVGAGVVGRGLQALQGLRGVEAGIEFGANANQVSHAFRHIDAVGLSRDAVVTAIRADIPALQVGQGITRTVTVNGVDLTYRAHRVNETLVNVGRITPPRP